MNEESGTRDVFDRHVVFKDSFETCGLKGHPFGWSTSIDYGSLEFGWDNKIGYSGSKSLRISNSSLKKAMGYWFLKWDNTSDNRTKDYTISVYIKTEGVSGEGAGIYVDCEDVENRELVSSLVKGTHGWQEVVLRINVPSHVRHFNVRLFLSCFKGRAWFSDIKVTSSRSLLQLSKELPSGWHRGYLHYHTSFGRPSYYRVSPQTLISQMKQMGASFVFCVGDHGYKFGTELIYTGWICDKNYFSLCWKSSDPRLILVPASEYIIRFPGGPHPETKEPVQHHCMVAYWKQTALKAIEPIDTARFFGNPKEINLIDARERSHARITVTPTFIKEAHENNIEVSLCHPALTFNGWEGVPQGPFPNSVPEFYDVDYYELFNGPFDKDFDCYLRFLSDERSLKMGCYAGTEENQRGLPPCESSTLKRCTYMYIPERFDWLSLRRAWNNRQTYAVYGFLYFRKLFPVPSKEDIVGTKTPRIQFTVDNSIKRPINKVEIYNKGKKVYEDKGNNSSVYSFSWKDKNAYTSGDSAHYIIHIQAESDHLVTSPINYSFS